MLILVCVSRALNLHIFWLKLLFLKAPHAALFQLSLFPYSTLHSPLRLGWNPKSQTKKIGIWSTLSWYIAAANWCGLGGPRKRARSAELEYVFSCYNSVTENGAQIQRLQSGQYIRNEHQEEGWIGAQLLDCSASSKTRTAYLPSEMDA